MAYKIERLPAAFPARLRRAIDETLTVVNAIDTRVDTLETGGAGGPVSIDYDYIDTEAGATGENIAPPDAAGQLLVRNINDGSGGGTHTLTFTTVDAYDGLSAGDAATAAASADGATIMAISFYYTDTWRWYIFYKSGADWAIT